MSNVIGYYYEDRIICVGCAINQPTKGEEAEAEAVPNGFTCDECWVVVNA